MIVADRLAMFPLGSVLLPHAPLALRLFEPRYLAMIDDVLAADCQFGVVLIERGHEVGGGEVRSSIGCRAQVQRAVQLADGTWQLIAVGTQRLEVVEWLDDDPYPLAMVNDYVDEAANSEVSGADATDLRWLDPRWLELVDAYRTLESKLMAKHPSAQPTPLSGDPAQMTFDMATALPVNSYDRQRVLIARSPEQRRVLLLDAIETLTTLVVGPDTN